MQLEETRELRVVVGPTELQELGAQLAREVQDLDDAVDRHASAKKAMKEDEETRQASIKRLSRIVATGIDHRPVKCRREYDYTRGTCTIFRTDTGEQIQIRDITDRERQETLPAMGGAENKDADFNGADPANPPRLGEGAVQVEPGAAAPVAPSPEPVSETPAPAETASPETPAPEAPKARKRNRKR